MTREPYVEDKCNKVLQTFRFYDYIPPLRMLHNIVSSGWIKSNKYILCCLFVGLFTLGQSFAQKFHVDGVIRNEDGKGMPGVSVLEKSTSNGTTSGTNGEFELSVPKTSILEFSFVGYPIMNVKLDTLKTGSDGNYHLNVVMVRDTASSLSDVVLVGYGTQKKSTVISSVTMVDPKEIKGPTSNLTTMLAGRIAGMISFQRSGEPGKDNASFFIRGVGTFGAGKVDPLILIDGIESSTTDLARLQPDDIAGFSVLKDATATSVYGARGANGVILISTKTGQLGKMKFNVRVENSTSSNIEDIKLADNISFMKLANEAVITRNPLGVLPYAQTKIDHTAKGDDPLLYPNNNWIDELTKPSTNTFRANANASGGGEKAKYYLAMTYSLDNGNLKNNSFNGFNNNIKLQTYSILSNVTLKLTKTTEAVVSLKGLFDDYNGPIDGGEAVYNSALWSNPVAFPAVYPAEYMPYAKHPLFGNAVMPGTTSALYSNPYASSLSGYQTYNSSTMTAQLSLKQNLNMITPGLSARAMAYTTRFAYFDVSRQISPYYYAPVVSDGVLNGIYLINDGSAGNVFPDPTEYLTYSPGKDTVNTTIYTEAAIDYSRTFNSKHSIGGMLIGTMRNYLNGNAANLQLSLPSRNLGLSGRFTYGYDNRYLMEFDFGYNGSERFAAKNRFGFFPSIGGGWVVSNEKFFEPLLNAVSNLKFRFTYGLVGNDQIGDANDRFFYLSQVGLDGASTGNFGTNFTYSRPTVYIDRYENDNITWERSRQTNLGMDLTLFKDLKITVDAYKQYRYDILMVRSTIPTTMGLQAAISANTGEASSKGVDISLDYTKNFSNSWWLSARGNFTYATSKVLVNEEPDYSAANANLSKVGNSMNQMYGLVAERLFTDDVEVANSPVQFGDIMAGDIKYRDINGDGKISSEDYVPIGLPTVPEIVYGFGFSIGYKNFDLSAFFQGDARTSFQINPADITPFVNQNGLLNVISNDHWSENDRNPYAFWPRLNNIFSENNDQSSSWWLRDGSFMRLKSAELGFNFPAKLLKRYGMTSCRLYLNGTNLFTFSAFKLWDPEMGASGLGYPIQRVMNVGVQIGL
ncbi:TonB-linked outer membrane protein, SusC/RagA family [Arachidicoccus rhizosphaerae]|uniref:TonB-linked outer membrane protein, SusC/RagA family n=1 Tax=Arachidicoccus rhizosphaerae TaxID=551991 RepID=A0A1H3Y6N9_9BACT|nr:TonB-dependent receptor [Arachidicoccus rhizosphaerae]SEA07223.1 TonB-linked outer membrane protein, SusC/RagA family [Arachidicoccus rhizosphaerae]